MKKRILSVLLSLVMVVGLLPTTALAATLPTMTAQIDGDYLKWNAVDGAGKYCIFIKDTPVKSVKAEMESDGTQKAVYSFNLKEYCMDRYPNGNLSVKIAAYAESGGALTDFTSAGVYSNSSATKVQLATPTNVQWTGFDLSWNPVTNATGYTVILTREYYVDGLCRSENYYRLNTSTNSINIRDYCVPDIEDYRVYITATATAPNYLESERAYSQKRYSADELAGLPTRELQNVQFDYDSGILSWDQFDGAERYEVEVFNISPLQNYSRQSATGYVTQSDSRLTFDVGAFCYENDIRRTGDYITACRVLLTAIKNNEDISAKWMIEDYEYNYSYTFEVTPLLDSKVTYSGAARYGQTLTANVTGLPDGSTTDNLTYQWQYKDGGSWVSIGGATAAGYVATDNVIGKDIRVMVTVDNYLIAICGAPVTVQKNWNMGIPTSPKLSYASGSSTLTITNDSYNANQEYCWTTAPSKDPTTGSAVWPSSSVGTNRTLTGVTPGTTYYVYTRFKETNTREVGRILGVAKYTVPTVDGSTGTISATDLTYPAYGEDGGNGKRTPTIYLKKGEHITVEYQLSPNNANANLPKWNETYTTTDGSDASVTVTNDATDKTLTITAGDKTGTVNVTAYKDDAHTERWQYGTDHSADGRTITVKIYDPTDLSTVPFPYLPVDLGEVTLYAGDTYTVTEDMMKNALNLPAGVNKDGYHYSAYIKTEDVTTGAPNVGTTALDGSVEVANNMLTAKQAGSATVYVFARTDDTVPANAGEGGYFAYFNVTVKARPALTDLAVIPSEVTLPVGDSYQFTATKTPDTAGGDITWSSGSTSVATVDSTGKVTTVAAGTTTITAACGGLTASVVVTVKAECEIHDLLYTEKDSGHEAVCRVCGFSGYGVLEHVMNWTESSGKRYGKCSLCGYTTETTIPTHSGSSVTTYAITVKDAKNGDVTADRKSASSGTTVTVTVAPDKGYTLETLTVLDKNSKEVKLTDKGNGKYTFQMPASSVTVKATFMDDNTMLNFFVDVPTDAYFADAVLWAAENGITGGMDVAHFAPYATCTRAQAVTFLWRAAGCPAPKSTTMPFTDVASGSYCYDAVLWAVENGITKGTTETTFSPNAECSRAQIVTFLWRTQKSPVISAANPFTDVSADAYYASAVLWAAANGITGGTTATTFSPNANCTRAQIVTFIYRCMK